MLVQNKIAKDDRYCTDIPEGAELQVTRMHANGVPAVGKYFLQGALVGRRQWDPEGYLTQETPFQEGCKHGVEYSWYEPGVLTLAEPYVSGLVHGTAQQWDDDGSLLGTYTMVHGTGMDLWRTRGADGAIYLSEVFYLERGHHHGFEWWLNNDQASVYEERLWRVGVPHGIERKWDLDGNLYPGFPRYFISGGQVVVEAYRLASAQDPSLPAYRVEDDRPQRNFPEEIVTEIVRGPGPK